MYQSVCRWRDLTDGHLYSKGDIFPHDGRDVSPERLDSLISGRNSAGFALICWVGVTGEEIPVPEPEPAKKPVRRRKTASK